MNTILSHFLPATSSLDTVQVVTGYQCNARCGHCGVANRQTTNLLDTTLFQKILNECADLGFAQFILTGGEPTLYSKHMRLATEFISIPGRSVRILSNGWFGNEEQALKKYIGPFLEKGGQIKISLNDYLAEHIPPAVSAMAVKKILQYHEKCQILCIAGATSYGLVDSFLNFFDIKSMHYQKSDRTREVLSGYLGNGKKITLSFKGGVSPMGRGKEHTRNLPKRRLSELPGHCDVSHLTFSPAGDVLLCPVSLCFRHLVLGNMKNNSLKQILKSSLAPGGQTPFYYIRKSLQSRKALNAQLFFNQCDVCYKIDSGEISAGSGFMVHYLNKYHGRKNK